MITLKLKKRVRRKQKQEEKRNRLSLTITFTIVIFAILFASFALAVGFAYLFSYFDIFHMKFSDTTELMPFLLFLILSCLVISSGLAFLILRIPLMPFVHMVSQMNRLADGDFSARVKIGKLFSTHPTFKGVEESFNKMAAELEGTEMLRTDFVNNFSHEFKTPIVSIAGFAKLLKRKNISQEQKEEYIRIIEEESLRLSDMANNVLNLTKVENQNILTDVTSFNLSEQIRSCVLLLEDKWSRKNTEFSLEFQEYEIAADSELLRQVWINLIDNAIKFSPKRSTVEIRMEENEEAVAVSITNPSRPIPEEMQKKLWRKFYQLDESRSDEGNGIGLAIVKRIVDLHGGDASVECGENRITFTITLPKEV